MTTRPDLDRLLGAVLEADGPQTVPPGLVEAALAEARSTGQRRPLLRPLDPLAWPPVVGPLPHLARRRIATLAIVALLVAAAIALALLVGGPRPPRVLADGQRAFVWLGDRAYQFSDVGSTEHQATPRRGGWSCPKLVPGTTVFAQAGFMGWDLVDVATDILVAHISFNTAGSERMSSDGRRLAILDLAGRIGVATVGQPSATELVWYDVPGIHAFDWSRSGDRLAILSAAGSEIILEVLDAASGIRRPVLSSALPAGDWPGGTVRWSSDGPYVLLAIGADVRSVAIVDTRTGTSIEVPGISGAAGTYPDLDLGAALSADGTSIALVRSPTEILIADATGRTVATIRTSQPARDLAWSTNGDRLAFRDGDTLVAVDRDGTDRRAATIGANFAFRWDLVTPELIVASAGVDGIAVERYETTSLTPVARLEPPPSSVGPSPRPGLGFVDAEANPICIQLDDVGPSGDP